MPEGEVRTGSVSLVCPIAKSSSREDNHQTTSQVFGTIVEHEDHVYVYPVRDSGQFIIPRDNIAGIYYDKADGGSS